MNSEGLQHALAGRSKSLVRHADPAEAGEASLPRVKNKQLRRLAPQHRILMLAIMLLALAAVHGEARKAKESQLKYAGGTEQIQQGCPGNLELTSKALTFRCAGGSISAPYSSISLMQYRSDISRQVWKMKLAWKVKPTTKHGKRNRYFTVLYNQGSSARAIVLDVTPEAMRPYLAEIDIKAGKRVEVQAHEEYYQ